MTLVQCCCTGGAAWSDSGSDLCEVCPLKGESKLLIFLHSKEMFAAILHLHVYMYHVSRVKKLFSHSCEMEFCKVLLII